MCCAQLAACKEMGQFPDPVGIVRKHYTEIDLGCGARRPDVTARGGGRARMCDFDDAPVFACFWGCFGRCDAPGERCACVGTRRSATGRRWRSQPLRRCCRPCPRSGSPTAASRVRAQIHGIGCAVGAAAMSGHACPVLLFVYMSCSTVFVRLFVANRWWRGVACVFVRLFVALC